MGQGFSLYDKVTGGVELTEVAGASNEDVEEKVYDNGPFNNLLYSFIAWSYKLRIDRQERKLARVGEKD